MADTDIISIDFMNSYKDKKVPWGFNGLGFIVFKRTYARIIEGENRTEEWYETIRRCINGAQKIGAQYTKEEAERLFDYIFNLKCNFAGRMLWQLGTDTVNRFGSNGMINCWFCSINSIKAFTFLFENLMLGGGVGFSVRKEDVHELPKVKKNVIIENKNTKDADFIVPDSREGWVRLLQNILESYFNTGKGFSYSCILVRGAGEKINGFGGTASGPQVLIDGMDKICKILKSREGKKLRSIDALDVCNIIGSIVVAGNVRRSSEISLGDPDDYLFLRAKRWDLGNIPNWRAMSNNTIYADNFSHISNDFWQGYDGNGEAYGLINLPLIQKYGRLKDRREDNAVGMNPCVSGDTLILTDKGYIRIDSIIGQKVNIWNGFEWSEVVPSITGYNQSVMKIILSDGRSIKCTPYHRWIISTNYTGGENEKRSIELRIGDKIIKNNFPVVSGGNKIDKSEAYTQGFISADGMDGYKYFWVYGEKKICEKRFKGKRRNYPHTSSTGIDRYQFMYDFEAKPKDYVPLDWNLESRLNWIAGLLDGDGTELKEGGAQICSIDKNFLLEIQKLLSITGVQSKVVHASDEGYKEMPDGHGTSKKYFCQNLWRICIGATQIQFLKSLGMHCERLSFEKNPNRDASQFVKIVGIEDAGYEDIVYCFTEPKRHTGIFNGILTGQCGEIGLADFESCNLSELYLNNLSSKEEMLDCAKLLYKVQKVINSLNFLHEESNKIVHKNMRIGIGITGICQSLNKIEWCDYVYNEMRKFDVEWSRLRDWNESIRMTTTKPSGTLSLLSGASPGVHPGYSKYFIRRVRMSSSDSLVNICREAGYKVEYVVNYDETEDYSTVVVEFPCNYSDETILAKDMSAVRQLNLVKEIQTEWSDNCVSATVYYKKEELPEIKKWLENNYETSVKSISFLLHTGHGFKQAPYEEITEEEYNKLISNIKQIELTKDRGGLELQDMGCESGVCPIK